MLRGEPLTTIQTAIARGEPFVPTPDQVRALQYQADRLRADALREALRAVFGQLRRAGHVVLPAGRIDVVRGH